MHSDTWLDKTILRSQGLGIFCGLSTVVLLAIGSFVLVGTADDASASIHMDDIRGFFNKPSWVHSWFYLLIPLFLLYALNTLLATWHTITRKLLRATRAWASYGPPLLHVSFLFALLAHLCGGVFAQELPPAVVAGVFRPLHENLEVRTVKIDREVLANGMPKHTRVHLELRRPNGSVDNAVVDYNQPLSEVFGYRLYLLGEAGQVPVVSLRVGDATCQAAEHDSCAVGDATITISAVSVDNRTGVSSTMASVSHKGTTTAIRFTKGRVVTLANGLEGSLERIEVQPAVLLRGRISPGNPLALLSAVLLGLGLLAMTKRWVP